MDQSIQGASERAESAFREQYPAIYNHLLQHKVDLENRNKAETGVRYEWYALQRWGANYWEDFSKQKIVWARLMRISKNDSNSFPRFSLVPKDYFTVDSLCFFVGNDLEYLQAILNSTVGAYYFFNNIAILDNGGMQMRQQYIENMPIPNCNDELRSQILDLASKMPMNKSGNDLDVKMNEIVYSIFSFQKEEIEFIDNYIADKKKEISMIELD